MLLYLVGAVAAQKRKQNVVTVGKKRRESLVQSKRLCRVGTSSENDGDVLLDSEMITGEEQSILDTVSVVEELKSAVAFQYVKFFFFFLFFQLIVNCNFFLP